MSRSTVPVLAGPVPVRPGPAADVGGAQGLAREPSPGGRRPGGPRLLDDGVPPGGRCRLLGVFAHPDDETFCAGGTFARYAEQGAEIMVVSATRGQAGQIRDAAAGTRRTIAAVREAELRLACERLGITKVRCLDHVDGTLADAGFPALVDEVAEVIGEFRPDVVITFGPDGGYGHPDHVTISAATTAACQRAAGPGHRPGRTAARPLAPAAAAVLPVLPAGRPADDGAAGDLADQPAGPLRRDARLCPRAAAAGRGGPHDAAHPRPRPGPLVPAGFVRRGAGRGGRRVVLDLVRPRGGMAPGRRPRAARPARGGGVLRAPAPQRRRGCRRQPHLPGPVCGTAGQVRWPGPGSPPGRCPARRAGGRVPGGRERAGSPRRRLLRRVRAGHA